jgi:hypothetical protein
MNLFFREDVRNADLQRWKESFELLLKFGKSSFLRKQESSSFKIFWIPAYAGMTKWGDFSKLSENRPVRPF